MQRRVLTTFRIGAWSWVVTGVGHLALTAVAALGPGDPGEAGAVAAMRGYRPEIPGVRRSLYDLDQGMSLVMAVALIFGGLVCAHVARSAPDLVTRSRRLRTLALLASLAALGVSLWLLPAPPIALFTIATVTFAWSSATTTPPSPATTTPPSPATTNHPSPATS
ncbi:hypothetical protein C8E97_3447 [Saccharothrix australiensis]|uniref:Uncharacterized protein n=2 Tax=Saccharothrix australiensis TaxID=2072 RepID=A0A495W4S0_9PSEU|nr:hypothetical protein C8E97_3447 [Saccharothrix australiensis]